MNLQAIHSSFKYMIFRHFSFVKVLLPMIILATVLACSDDRPKVYVPPLSANDSTQIAEYREQALSSTTPQDAEYYAKQAYELARVLGRLPEEGKALLLLYEIYYDNGQNAQALECATKASHIGDTLNDLRLRAESYHALGNVLSRFKNNPIAAKNFADSFFLYFRIEDTIGVTNVWRDLIPAYVNANIFDSAMIAVGRCKVFAKRLKDDRGMAETIAQEAATELAMFRCNAVSPDYSHLRIAYQRFRQAEAMNREFNDKKIRKILVMGLMETLYNLSVIEEDPVRRQQLADSSMLYLPEACVIAQKTGVAEVIHRVNILGVKVHYATGDMKSTKHFVDSLVSVADNSNLYIDKETAYRAQSIFAAYNNDFDNAFAYRVLAEKNREVINYSDQSFLLSIQLAKGQNDDERAGAKRREAALKSASERQKLLIMMGIIFITLLLVIGTIIFHNYQRTQKLNAKINAINEEMRVQSEEIRVKSEEIMDGISYASIIQFAAMPSAAEMKHTFGDCLVYLEARNVVSGDFYWASGDVSGRYKLLAVGDCTGHGVPGALLSMLGMSILDYTTRHFGAGEISAGIVLDKMRNNFKRTLNQTSFSSDKTIDSIDIVLLVFDTQDKVLHYAAAFRPLLMFRYGEMMRMKADSMPIGIYPREKPHFTDNVMKLCKGDIIYLYSDGLTDQSGYEDAAAQYPRAYSTKQFFKLLKSIFQQPFAEQEATIREAMDNWRLPKSANQVECEKTDDATIVGVAVNNFIKFDDI